MTSGLAKLLVVLVTFLASSAVSLLAVLIVVLALPADHFVLPHARDRTVSRHPLLRLLPLALKSAVGALLIAVGILLTIPGVPGQGILTILAGVLLVDIPGKRRLERWLVRRRGVMPALARLRARFGRPPFESP